MIKLVVYTVRNQAQGEY